MSPSHFTSFAEQEKQISTQHKQRKRDVKAEGKFADLTQ